MSLKNLDNEQFDFLSFRHEKILENGDFNREAYLHLLWVLNDYEIKGYDVSIFKREIEKYKELE